MNETPQEYIARILTTLGGRDPLSVLTETPARLRSLVSSATADQLTWKADPSRWSITQILAHLADAEVVACWRYRAILERDGGPIAAYDQDEWARAFKYDQVPVAESLATFETLRRSNLHLLERVDASRRKHVGIHSERGPESITRLMEMFGGHDLNHLGQIERLLEESTQRATATRTGA
jgi:hypothetical protein